MTCCHDAHPALTRSSSSVAMRSPWRDTCACAAASAPSALVARSAAAASSLCSRVRSDTSFRLRSCMPQHRLCGRRSRQCYAENHIADRVMQMGDAVNVKPR